MGKNCCDSKLRLCDGAFLYFVHIVLPKRGRGGDADPVRGADAVAYQDQNLAVLRMRGECEGGEVHQSRAILGCRQARKLWLPAWCRKCASLNFSLHSTSYYSSFFKHVKPASLQHLRPRPCSRCGPAQNRRRTRWAADLLPPGPWEKTVTRPGSLRARSLMGHSLSGV